MKQAWRIIRFSVFALIGGAVVSVLVAEGIGVSGRVRYEQGAPERFVAVGGQYVQAHDMRGPGWRYLLWSAMGQRSAAILQYMYDNHLEGFEGRLSPSYLHPDPPDSLPRWARLWDPANWPPAQRMDAWDQREDVAEVGVGWPMTALCTDWDSDHRNKSRGGKMLPTPPGTSVRLLLWRPIPLGLAADTLFYAVGVAGLAAGARLAVRIRRKRRCACPACGYDLAGLAAGAVCPECGAAVRVVGPAHPA